jgi:hypothetical protein
MPRIAAILFVAGIIGCGEFEPLELHPLRGKINRLGVPVKDGGLIFLPENPGRTTFISNASVRDGAFEACTDRTSRSGKTLIEKGVPKGKYSVVYHPASDGSKSGLEVRLDAIEVTEGGTVITLELPGKMPTGKGEPRDDVPAGHTVPGIP